jgi:AsmA protein
VTSDGTVHAQHLQLRPNAAPIAKPVDITFKAAHNLAANTGQLMDAAAQTGKVMAHLSGTYAITSAATTVNMKFAADKVPMDDLQALLPAAGVKLPRGSALRGGTLTTNLTITGPLADNVISGPVEVDNTSLAGFNLASKLSSVVGAAGGQTGDVTRFQTIRMNVTATKAWVKTENIYAMMPSLGEATGTGSVMANDTINFRLTMKVDTSRGVGGAAVGLLAMMNGTAGKTAAEAAKNGLPVTITGTTSDPIITPDVNQMMHNNATEILGKGSNPESTIQSLTSLFGKGKK